jgi:S1-C subfamily serine protease
MSNGDGSRITRLRSRIFGDDRHFGLWILPLFVMAALLGAVLVGGLTALYYGQQVSDLEEATSRARRNLDEVAASVDKSAKDARRDIDRQVNQARDEFSRNSPVDSPASAGVYAVTATHPGGEVRVASAFTVFSNSAESFLITSYALVDDGRQGALDAVEVFLPDGTVTAPVHSFDADRDLSVLILSGGPLPVSEWRPVEERVQRGDAVYAVGVAGPNTPTVLEGRVAGVSDLAFVPNLPLNDFMAGGPLVDGGGRVIAISSQHYAPFGDVEGDLVYAPPIRMVCEVLIDCTAADVSGEG